MRNTNHRRTHSRWLITALTVIMLIFVQGCGDFIQSKSTGQEAEAVLQGVSRIDTPAEPNITMPAIYTEPPKIIQQTVGGQPEWKLFYFGKHHTSDNLKQMVYDQFASKLFDAKGKETRIVDYGVSSNPATNQLIVRCPAREDVDAVLQFLENTDVAPIQVKIDCLISEIYADKTLDWETTLLIENLLGENIWAGPTAQPFGSAVMDLVEEASVPPAFPGASMRELGRSKMGLKLGFLSASHRFLSLVDLLESKGYMKVLMHPSVEVVNGKTATISSSQKVPLQQTYLTSARAEWFESSTQYVDVVDSLRITPHVFVGDGSIGLETSIELGSKLTPEGVKQLPIITKKQIDNKENRIRQGSSLVIGGIRKIEKRDVIRGVPFLKDIPLLGILFSGRDFEERVVETIFVLTPTISTGGIPQTEMVERVRERHETHAEKEGLRKLMSDPLGLEARRIEHQAKIREAEESRLRAEGDKAEARHAVRQARTELQRARQDAQRARDEADKARVDAEKAIAEAEKTKADAEAKTKAAEQAKAAAEKATGDATKIKADAEKLVEEANKARQEAEKTMADAQVKVKAAEKAKAEAEAAKAALQPQPTTGAAEPTKQTQNSQQPDKAKGEPDNAKTTGEQQKPKAAVQEDANAGKATEKPEKAKDKTQKP
jgi:hypothetical protein